MVNNAKSYARIRRKEITQKIIARIFVWLVLIIMYLPILYLVFYSFNSASVIGQKGEFSFKPFELLFSSTNGRSEEIWRATFNTMLVALTSSTLATIIGSLGAIGIFYSKKLVKNSLNVINQIPVVNAEIVMALSLIILLVRFDIERSFLTLVAGHMVLAIPFVVLSVQPKLTQMDPNLYEAAMDLGATPTKALNKVVLPEILPGVISGFMLSFTLSLDDFIITAFTKPSKLFDEQFHTLSTYVESIIKKQGLPIQLRALTTIIFFIILIGMIVYNVVIKKKLNKRGN